MYSIINAEMVIPNIWSRNFVHEQTTIEEDHLVENLIIKMPKVKDIL